MNSKSFFKRFYHSFLTYYVVLLFLGALVGFGVNYIKEALGYEEIIFWGRLGREALSLGLTLLIFYLFFGRKIFFKDCDLEELKRQGRMFFLIWGMLYLIASLVFLALNLMDFKIGIQILVFSFLFVVLSRIKLNVAILLGMVLDIAFHLWPGFYEQPQEYWAGTIAMIILVFLFLYRFLVILTHEKRSLI